MKKEHTPRTIHTCNRCGYQWISNKAGTPKTCANQQCRSPYWNKERVFPIRNTNEETANN